MSDNRFSSPWDIPDTNISLPDATGTSTPADDFFNPEPLDTEAEIDVWSRRADELWHAASSAGDLRSACVALNIALRNLRARQDQLEAQRSLEVPPNEAVTIAMLDEIVRQARADIAARGECCSTCGKPLVEPEPEAENGEANGSND